jgi:mRNA-degrading endonuclease toxin of MazEF toxin-antitoxin module
VQGVVMTDHLKSVDWQARKAQAGGRVPDDILRDVLERIRPLLGF